MVQVDWLCVPSNGSLGGSKTPGLHTYNACLHPLLLCLCSCAMNAHDVRMDAQRRTHESSCHTRMHVVQVAPTHGTIHQGPTHLANTAESHALHAVACRACVHITHAMYVLCGGQPRLCRCNPCTHSISVSHISIRARVYIR